MITTIFLKADDADPSPSVAACADLIFRAGTDEMSEHYKMLKGRFEHEVGAFYTCAGVTRLIQREERHAQSVAKELTMTELRRRAGQQDREIIKLQTRVATLETAVAAIQANLALDTARYHVSRVKG